MEFNLIIIFQTTVFVQTVVLYPSGSSVALVAGLFIYLERSIRLTLYGNVYIRTVGYQQTVEPELKSQMSKSLTFEKIFRKKKTKRNKTTSEQ